ncbi:hypothetical protein Ahy_B09g095407 [Arachis hypogaea]|uniref:CCHC-type domain-containing protein n=1 Tax=Arachis hypogaea TaxID=3818 RepID=A0A444XDP6_ARAHY|nr:hypothetical protein Ahy_B09g095407 [Arachis hypogaea]
MAASAAFQGLEGALEVLEEDQIIQFGEEDIKEGLEKCTRSLVGRLMADRKFSAGTLEAALLAIWRQPVGFKVLDHGGNVFQFFFEKEIEMIRIENGAPWLFKNYILNLKRWKGEDSMVETEFLKVPIWIQLWGLPEHCKTKELGRKLGRVMGEVMDVDLFILRGKEEQIVKVQIGLDVTKPLRRSMKIAGGDKKVIELQVKYEKIGNFCYYCGFLGHEARGCSKFFEDSAAGKVDEEKWGPWVRAEQFGRMVSSQKENQNPHSDQQSEKKNQRDRKPTPLNLIKSFASLSVNEANTRKGVEDDEVESGTQKEKRRILGLADQPVQEKQYNREPEERRAVAVRRPSSPSSSPFHRGAVMLSHRHRAFSPPLPSMEPLSSEEPLLGEALAITVADEQGRKRRSDVTGEKGDLRHYNGRWRVARHHGVTILATV